MPGIQITVVSPDFSGLAVQHQMVNDSETGF
jgi:stress-induced morphogen